jgi:hypothetical protein
MSFGSTVRFESMTGSASLSMAKEWPMPAVSRLLESSIGQEPTLRLRPKKPSDVLDAETLRRVHQIFPKLGRQAGSICVIVKGSCLMIPPAPKSPTPTPLDQ